MADNKEEKLNPPTEMNKIIIRKLKKDKYDYKTAVFYNQVFKKCDSHKPSNDY